MSRGKTDDPLQLNRSRRPFDRNGRCFSRYPAIYCDLEAQPLRLSDFSELDDFIRHACNKALTPKAWVDCHHKNAIHRTGVPIPQCAFDRGCRV